MPEPKSLEELKETTWYKEGQRLRRERKSVTKAAAMLRIGCWQQDALLAGYDAPKESKAKVTPL